MSEKVQTGAIEKLIDAAEVAADFAKAQLSIQAHDRATPTVEVIHALEAATSALLAAHAMSKDCVNTADAIKDRLYGRRSS
jgi:hypothetical protein